MSEASLTSGDLESDLESDDPFALFTKWLAEASTSELNDPNAMALAAVDADGLPDVRMVLLNGFDAAGFVFFTNFESAKGRELLGNAKAALCFHWKSLRRQVRVRGPVEIVSAAEADAYFAGRPRGSQVGAWASRQSRPLESRRQLLDAVATQEARFGDGEIARPPWWSGFRVLPSSMEFWRDRPFRLHDRMQFTRDGGIWTRRRLFP